MKIRIRDIHTGIMGAGVPIPVEIADVLDYHKDGAINKYFLLCRLVDTADTLGKNPEINDHGDMITLKLTPNGSDRTHSWRLCFYDEVIDE